jgi:hypothetical protein
MSQKNDLADFKALIEAYHNDIGLFAKQVFDSTLTPKQLEFCEAFRTSRMITFRGGVGFGKTHAEAIITWWCLITHDQVQVSIFGPSEPQLLGGIWKEVGILHARMHPMFKDAFEVTTKRISRKVNGASCFADLRLANDDKPDNARGIHALGLNAVLVDEASGVGDSIFEVLLNILTDPNPKLCLVSNPSKASGFFYRTHTDPDISQYWTKIHGRMADSPHFNEETFEQLAKNYGGPTSRNYRVMVEGEFPLSDIDGLIPRDILDAAIENADAIQADNAPIIWSVDPAGAGADTSALCIRKDNRVLDLQCWNGLDPTQLSYKIRDLYQATKASERPCVIVVDAVGLGNGVWSNLKDWGLPTHAVNFKNKPTRHQDRYVNFKDQLYWETREWFASENVSIPNNAKLIEEAASIQYGDESGKVRIEEKKATKKRIGRSPDFFDALAMTFAINPSRYSSKYSWSKPLDIDWLNIYE